VTSYQQDLWPSGGDRWYARLSILIKQTKNPWWDDVNTTDKIETRDDILLAAMINARKEITSLDGARHRPVAVGEAAHCAAAKSDTGNQWDHPIENLFNRGHYPVGGGPAVVNAMGYDDRTGYTVTDGRQCAC
jgi:penicillin amidase